MSNVTSETVTYRRIRAALIAARDSGEVTVLQASTELSLPTAARYARDHVLLERLGRVRIAIRAGKIEIGPERRGHTGDRRSGFDRRVGENIGNLWAERRATVDRRGGSERRHAPVPAYSLG